VQIYTDRDVYSTKVAYTRVDNFFFINTMIFLGFFTACSAKIRVFWVLTPFRITPPTFRRSLLLPSSGCWKSFYVDTEASSEQTESYSV
jgi:hypothetical protein